MAAVSSAEPFSTITISKGRPRSRSPEATSRTDSSSIPASLWAGRTTVKSGGTPVGYRPREPAWTPPSADGRPGGALAALRLAGAAARAERGGGGDRPPPAVEPRPAPGAAGRGPGDRRPGAGRRRAAGAFLGGSRRRCRGDTPRPPGRGGPPPPRRGGTPPPPGGGPGLARPLPGDPAPPPSPAPPGAHPRVDPQGPCGP